MIRTIISLSANEKEWLDQISKLEHIPRTQIVRIALQEYRRHHDRGVVVSDVDSLLQQTKGIWENKDGLSYQIDIRDEWSD